MPTRTLLPQEQIIHRQLVRNQSRRSCQGGNFSRQLKGPATWRDWLARMTATREFTTIDKTKRGHQRAYLALLAKTGSIFPSPKSTHHAYSYVSCFSGRYGRRLTRAFHGEDHLQKNYCPARTRLLTSVTRKKTHIPSRLSAQDSRKESQACRRLVRPHNIRSIRQPSSRRGERVWW